MSWRDTLSRQNGDSRPVFFPAGSVDVYLPGVNKIRRVLVRTGSNACTAAVLVNGVQVAAQSPGPAVSIPANTSQKIGLNGVTVNEGDRLQVTLSDAGARVSISFFAA